MTDDLLWYKDAIIYQLHVKAFFDSSNDGIGDFAGLTAKLDYLQDLGVNTIWVLPFYPSPLRDDGYDIADYMDVHPSYGTLDDFRAFVREAHTRGLRVITELVANHTSDQHPWFQRARHAPAGSPERDFYVWSDTNQRYEGTRIIFSDTETSNWTWDPEANAYYWHRFFSHQPDLNFDNPLVLEAIIEAMYFWLEAGVDGLRLDAVPYLCEREGTNNENLPETHVVLKKIRAALEAKYPGRMLLAEANQWPEDVLAYFGDGDECHMAFHFPLMPRIYMAVAQEDRHPVTDIMAQTPDIPPNCQWANFLRNHDELTLEMVTDRERDYLWNFYAADKRARINFGIRRRLAPLMDNDRRKIELLGGLLMSMPGTPVLYYGDEIGMGDNIYLGDRNGVRTPMQWSPDRNGGFSLSDPAQLYLPAIMDPVYGFQSINVEAQRRLQNSLFTWTRNLIAIVKTTKCFGRGTQRFLTPANRKVLAYLREFDGETVLCVANLSRAAQAVELDLREFGGFRPVEMIGQTRFPLAGALPYLLTLSPYGFYWFRLEKEESLAPEAVILPELSTLVLGQQWGGFLQGRNKTLLERQILPSYLMRQRWYKSKNAGLPLVEAVESFAIAEDYRILIIRATAEEEMTDYYVLACGIAWESMTDPYSQYQNCSLSRVRKSNRVGILYEASGEEEFLAALLAAFTAKRTEKTALGTLIFRPRGQWPDLSGQPLKSLGAEQTNSSALVGDQVMLKLIRRPQPGINPELEFGHFFSEISPFERTPALMGEIQIEGISGAPLSIGLAQQAVRNQGDGWRVTLDYLARLISDNDSHPEEIKPDEQYGYYLTLAKQLGVRTAQMHNALALPSAQADFKPETVTDADRREWREKAEALMDMAFAGLERGLSDWDEKLQADAQALPGQREPIHALLASLLPKMTAAKKTRVHGDYHLGQVLVVQNDFYLIDFEGESGLTLDERRRKTSPLKDVAGMIRSFDYAAATAFREARTMSERDEAKLARLLENWRIHATSSFLEGYRETIESGEPDEATIRFFALTKALYEIVYELGHRPDWLPVPLRGLLALLAREQN